MSTDAHAFPPVDTTQPQLTVRAIVTGMLLGAALSLCNIYSGLKIGWGFNMSITAALLGFGFWKGVGAVKQGREFGLLENNINQTAASAAASISSAGLVAPIPALTMMTGQTLSWVTLSVWVLSVALVGVVVAILLRRQLIVTDNLPFPNGIASAETLKEMYAKGAEAMARVKMLLLGALIAAGVKVLEIKKIITKVELPLFEIDAQDGGAVAAAGVKSLTTKNLSFLFDPSLMMMGVGALIGVRACVSMMFGAVVAWFVIAPELLEAGLVPMPSDPAKIGPDKMYYGGLIKWLLWPGVAMMVTCSLTSVSFSFGSMKRAFTGGGGDKAALDPSAAHDVPKRVFLVSLLVVLVASVLLQFTLFDIGVGLAAVGVLLTFALAVVAGRVSGETGVTPVGPMGKVTQFALGVIAPGQPATNLMAANVTGGAASQCADMLHDLKTGALVGSAPKSQILAQALGVFAGALAGSAAYLVLVPDPANMLLTEEWPAPAVVAWKAVAEVFAEGIENMPPGTLTAMGWAGLAGVVLAILEKVLPNKAAKWVPSPASMGLAFVIPAYYPVLFFIGGMVWLLGTKLFATWTKRFMIVFAAGVIAGESLTGVGDAILKVIEGLAGGG